MKNTSINTIGYEAKPPELHVLASLASNIQTETTAKGKVEMALLIWSTAHDSIVEYTDMHNFCLRIMPSKYLERIRKCDFYDGIKLVEFLKRLFPRSKPEDTMKWYRDYLKAHFSFKHPEMNAEQIQEQVNEIIERRRTEGITNAQQSAYRFAQYRESASAKTRKVKSANAAKSVSRQKKAPDTKISLVAAKNGVSKAPATPSKKSRTPSKN